MASRVNEVSRADCLLPCSSFDTKSNDTSASSANSACVMLRSERSAFRRRPIADGSNIGNALPTPVARWTVLYGAPRASRIVPRALTAVVIQVTPSPATIPTGGMRTGTVLISGDNRPMTTPPFPELLSQIEDRSDALRAAAASAPEDARVPGCPDWVLRDLVAHVGKVQRFWAAVFQAGLASEPPKDESIPDRIPSGDLLSWSAASTDVLLAAQRDATGAERGCWTWWGEPRTVGAVARHQVQEAAVHAWDAQETGQRAQPLPPGIAADGVDEFLSIGVPALPLWGSPRPHEPTTLGLRAHSAGSWLLTLGPGDVAAAATGSGDPARAQLVGSAGDLVLALYHRRPLSALHVAGDRMVAERFLAWLTPAL